MIQEDYTFKPVVKCLKDIFTIQYKTDKGFRIHQFTKENVIKFFSVIKKQLDKKQMELKGVDLLIDKFSYKVNSEYVLNFFEQFKLELMYETGKKERPPKKTFSMDDIELKKSSIAVKDEPKPKRKRKAKK